MKSKNVLFFLVLFVLVACQNMVDDQSGINSKIEDFVKNKLYPNDSLQSIGFSRFVRGTDNKLVYYWLDYTFSIKINGQRKALKYHFETDSLLHITKYKNISTPLQN
ncbi:hypothetical protein [Mucilaginibacter sp. NFX135]